MVMRSPMYFCKNLLLLSSLSCSSLTASIRLNIAISDSCRAFACLWCCCLLAVIQRIVVICGSCRVLTHLRSSSLASRPRASRSSLVRRGLMARISPTSAGSNASTESRGTMMVPLLFRLGRRGRTGTGATMFWPSPTEDAEEESERAMAEVWPGNSSW